MAEPSVEERLEFHGIGEEEIGLLAGLAPILEENADAFIEAFYRHLLSFESTRRFLRDPEVKRRLLGKQREYLLSLASPGFDDAWVEQRRRVGEVHERLGLEPRWYLGAYALYFSLLTPIVCDAFSHETDKGARVLVALQKLLLLDSEIAMETYIERHEKGLAYMAEELAREGRRLERDFRSQGATLRRTTERARVAEELASIATLVAGLAHEIGTPMGVIQGHAKMLEGHVRGDDAKWRLQTIRDQISRISRIIQTLLNMARPRKSRRQPVAIEPLIETTLSFVSEKLAHRQIELRKKFRPASSVVGDSERLQQLFLNLVLNAADSMPDGGILRVEIAEVAGGEVEVRIADTGAGIDVDDLDRIFEPFFTTKEAGHGNGLGLMVCKGIVADHDGAIEVSSESGQGTEFRIVLPGPDGPSGDRHLEAPSR